KRRGGNRYWILDQVLIANDAFPARPFNPSRYISAPTAKLLADYETLQDFLKHRAAFGQFDAALCLENIMRIGDHCVTTISNQYDGWECIVPRQIMGLYKVLAGIDFKLLDVAMRMLRAD